jgi:hypothetical protein
MITIKFLSLLSFVTFLILDYLIKNNYLGNSIKNFYFKFIDLNYFYIVLILTGIVFLILMLFSYFGVSLICFDNSLFDVDLFKAMSDSGSGVNNNTVKVDVILNINHLNLNVSVPNSSLNNLAAAVSVAGGGTLAKVAQQGPEGPDVKVVLAGTNWMASQALTVGVCILNSNNSSNNNTNNNINWFDGLSNNNLNDKFNDFPLNLLPEINQLVTAELMFLFIILNIFVVKYIITVDYNKYIANNKVGNILKYFINRYIMLWSKSVKFLLIVSWSGLFFCVIFSKIFLYYILNN